MITPKSRLSSAFAVLIILGVAWRPSPAGAQTPVGTAFTYQGRLTDASVPPTAGYDLTFSLFGAATGGSALAGPVNVDDISVRDGLFSVELDFGASAFNGDARWIEIGVRPGPSTGAYTTLSPRQKINPTPYAIRAAASGLGPGGTLTSGVPQLVRNFTAGPGQTIAIGDTVSIQDGQLRKGILASGFTPPVILNDAEPGRVSLGALSANSIIVAYTDLADGSKGKAVIATLSNGAITLGTPLPFSSGMVGELAVTALSATQFVIAFADAGAGKAVVGTVAAGVITLGSPFTFNAGSISQLSMDKLSGSTVAIAFADASNADHYTGIIGQAAANIIAFGSKSVLSSASGLISPTIAGLSDTLFVVVYRDENNSAKGTEFPVGVMGNSILGGGLIGVFYNGAMNLAHAVAVGPAQFVVTYFHIGGKEDGGMVAADISLSTPAFGDEVIFGTTEARPAIAALTPARLIIPFVQGASSGRAIPVSVDEAKLALGSKMSFSEKSNVGYPISVSAMSPFQYAINSVDTQPDSSNRNVLRVGDIRGAGLTGIARSAGGAGATISVTILPNSPVRGISDTHTGLIAGNYYYAQADGSAGLAETSAPLGRAISDTEIMFVDP